MKSQSTILKLFLSFVLSASFGISSLPVYAEGNEETPDAVPTESPDQENAGSDQSETKEETDSEKTESSDPQTQGSAPSETAAPDAQTEPVIKAVVVEKPGLVTPDTQNIVVSVDTNGISVTSGSVEVLNTDTNESKSYSSTEYTDGAFKFAAEYQDAGQAGAYKVVSVTLFFDPWRAGRTTNRHE